MTAAQDFERELHEMGTRNGAWLDPKRVTELVRPEIDEGATFVNIFRKVDDKKEFLLITTACTRALQWATFSIRVRWIVPHEIVEDVRVEQRVIRRWVTSVLVLEARDQTYEFAFGFDDSGGASRLKRDIAEQNATVAANEITSTIEAYFNAPVDPAFEELKRSMALIEAEPDADTESSEGWVLEDYADLLSWMREEWRARERRTIWEQRVALGYQLVQGPATQNQWFWINAFPAMAALRIGLKEHPLVATFAGMAENILDPDNEGQQKAVDDIRKRFFGPDT